MMNGAVKNSGSRCSFIQGLPLGYIYPIDENYDIGDNGSKIILLELYQILPGV